MCLNLLRVPFSETGEFVPSDYIVSHLTYKSNARGKEGWRRGAALTSTEEE